MADGETSEAQIADWVTPAYAMRAGDAGNWLVLAPTVYNLTCIASAQNAKEFVETRRRLTRFMSYPIKKEDGTVMLHCDFPKRKIGNAARRALSWRLARKGVERWVS